MVEGKVRRVLLVTVHVAVLVLGPASRASGSEVGIGDVLADGAAYDGQEVTVRGELVGDYGRRGDEVWVQVNGDSYADRPLLLGGPLTGSNVGIAARIPADLFASAGFEDAGGYRHRGPVARLTGTWRFHDADRTGESYLDVTAVEVVAHEQPLEEGPLWVPLGIGLGLVAAAAGFRLRRSGMRRRGRP
jgi:hypothetical protein